MIPLGLIVIIVLLALFWVALITIKPKAERAKHIRKWG
jgi:hypothetical protein